MNTLRSPATDSVSVMKESKTASRARPSVMPSRPSGSWARATALTAITQTNVVITQPRIAAILSRGLGLHVDLVTADFRAFQRGHDLLGDVLRDFGERIIIVNLDGADHRR